MAIPAPGPSPGYRPDTVPRLRLREGTPARAQHGQSGREEGDPKQPECPRGGAAWKESCGGLQRWPPEARTVNRNRPANLRETQAWEVCIPTGQSGAALQYTRRGTVPRRALRHFLVRQSSKVNSKRIKWIPRNVETWQKKTQNSTQSTSKSSRPQHNRVSNDQHSVKH